MMITVFAFVFGVLLGALIVMWATAMLGDSNV